MKRHLIALLLAFAPAPAFAESYVSVMDKDTFLSLIDGRQLRHGFYPITLNVLGNGEIQGSAIGWDITGSWDWQDGYFCRDLTWGGDPLGYNCQLVEVRSDGRIRFTVDRGAGDSAAFRLR
ncbi:dihydrodipicolinate reductase [Yoonia sp.]|uniref:dihydrodipicolinate reductase n=1 Tax=Yoonia sp. TaxID=2212373 RepID=UPI003F6CFAA0